MTEELIKQAQSGDHVAFDRLSMKVRPELYSYLYRRLASKEEADDLCQESLLQAYTHLKEYQGPPSFRVWLFGIASALSAKELQDKDPWSPEALDMLQEHLLANSGTEKQLQELYYENEEAYELGDHIDFCFTVLVKSLLVEEKNILLLGEINNLSPKEVGEVTGLDQGKVEKILKESTDNLSESLYQRCSLVRKGAPCTQCQDFGHWLEGEEKTKQQLEALPFDFKDKARESFLTRLDIIVDKNPGRSDSRHFHGELLRILGMIMGEKGVVK